MDYFNSSYIKYYLFKYLLISKVNLEMFAIYIVWMKLVFSLSCYVMLGWLFAWTAVWDEALQQDSAFTLSRVTLIFLTLTLTRTFAWKFFGVISWAKTLGWCYILSHGVTGILLLAFSGGITLYVVLLVVLSIAWAGAFSSVSVKNQLLPFFSQLHTVLILRLTLIFGLSLGMLARLSNP